MIVVLLTRDLMVVSRVEGAAARVGAEVRSAADASRACELVVGEQASLAIIDVATPGLEIGPLVEQLRAVGGQAPRVVAFGPHVHTERLAAARQAGCDEVVSRGEFFARIDAMLGG